ncbi:MAG: Serine/threonine-protein kinase [Peltula sp. TS41687]|nr:MAG: Serine/threonine-protein kinase [Peltula sp. TS41687]
MAAQAPAPSSSRRPAESGQAADAMVGQFRIQMEIGKGSFATVYRAIHLKTRSLVAVKSVHLHKLNKKLKENLYSEIHILKGLHHPHIVALIDCHETNAHINLVMEFCQLGDLSYFIKKRDRLASHPSTADMIRKYPSQSGGGLHEVIVRHFLQQLTSALEFLRARNFIHRDVKPQNLLLNPSPMYLAKDQDETIFSASQDSFTPVAGVASLPMLKIADFGFARSLPSTSLAETLCGSPLYMAPEILRYEKYDAKADLWSVGTVLYEMVVGRPPFRASNHVELLRRIERGEDRISFPEGLLLSEELKKLIRGLLKRNPVERIAFKDFFNHPVIIDEIPGLVDEDRPKETSIPEPSTLAPLARRDSDISQDSNGSSVEKQDVAESSEPDARRPAELTRTDRVVATPSRINPVEAQPTKSPAKTTTPSRPSAVPRTMTAGLPEYVGNREQTPTIRRPGMTSHATAPARQDLHQGRGPVGAAVVMDRQSSRNSSSPGSSLLVQQQDREPPKTQRNEQRIIREVREKAEQEVAFERDYVVVEKRAVEVNAFADELAASPRIHGALQTQDTAPSVGAITRRATSHGTPPSAGATQTTRAMQVATGKQRPDHPHQRRGSYERRYGGSPGSATSAISKALNMANFRLFGVGFSPPFGGKGGYSPPQAYGAFPAYPTSQGSLVMVGDTAKYSLPQDEDARAVYVIEEAATRSDVVYGFAEVKYKQLIPLAPSTGEHGLGLRATGTVDRKEKNEGEPPSESQDGLTIDAIVTLSEEALVLFVKALALLAKAMDIAGAWWARKNRGEVLAGSPSGRTEANAAALITAGNRINNVVQWVRTRFNEVLEKAEFVTLKLVEAQKQLPPNHPSHPSNHPVTSASMRMGTSADTVVVSSGVTAEKLMYERALEMSRAAAVNELVGEDLAGCEIAYVTAVRMLEAVLETDDEVARPRSQSTSVVPEGNEANASGGDLPINGMQVEDRQVVEKLVSSLRVRLSALRKKIAVISKRRSAAPGPSSSPKHGHVTKTVSSPEVPTVGNAILSP